MAWRSLVAFTNNMNGKQVRFKNAFNAPNLSTQFSITKVHGAQIPSGAAGRIYQVNGGTIYVGMRKDLKLAPPDHTSPTYYAATIQVYLDQMHKLEI